ncbi:ABC transporter permease [Nocardioides campestrisoli]|uniref:ABC transporter permease n=1 Tax=Nocardioides campestrisoli TaxID=2736757 RepID=UPI0015E793A2|nr:ABC transporter permease [Nocardioides campestrisoli]
MNPTIVRLSVQALLGRRRGLVLVIVPAVLLALSVVIRALTDEGVGQDAVLELGYTLAMPLVCLLAASAVLGPEVDDGSVVYLLAKPVNRHAIALSKYVVAWICGLVLGALPLTLCALVLSWSAPEEAVAWGVGGAVAATAYVALFLALAALTKHAVVVGLLVVLMWEGLLGNLLVGIRWVSIGSWGREVAASVSDLLWSPEVGLGYALGAAVVLAVASVWFAGDRLRSFTLRGDE